MSKKKEKKLYRYEVLMPVSEYWVMECYAESKKQIKEAIKNGEQCSLLGWGQIYGAAAPVGARKVKIFKKED